MKYLIIFIYLVSLNALAEEDEQKPQAPDFMICTSLDGEGDNNNEVNCVKTTNMNEARRELRRRGVEKRDKEKRYSKKLYPREHETSFLPQE